MAFRGALVLQLSVLVAIGQVLRVEPSFAKHSNKFFPKTSQGDGLTATLIHTDQYFAEDGNSLTHYERIERDARRNKLRVKSLVNRRGLGETGPAPPATVGGGDWETPLSDGAITGYLMQIWLGSPVQSFAALVDTASDLTWLQCAPCHTCAYGNCQPCSSGAIYKYLVSTTSQPLNCSTNMCLYLNETGSCQFGGSYQPFTGCDYSYRYSDGSQTSGTLFQDTITLQTVTGANQTVADFSFACSNDAATQISPTDGVVGLGRGNISFSTQLGTYFGNKFGYCLVNRSISNTAEYASPLFFGSHAVPTDGSQLQYTPMLSAGTGTTFYYVNCTGINLNGESIFGLPAFDIVNASTGNLSGGIFFDSGTQFTTLSANIYDVLTFSVDNIINQKYLLFVISPLFETCYEADWNDWINDYGKRVPSISFQFSNTSGFTLAVDTAWIPYNESGGEYISQRYVCLAMQRGPVGSNVNIFGSYQQVGYHILYDLENTQIGFAQANCNATRTGNLLPWVHLSNSPRPVARMGTSLVAGLLALLLLIVLR